MQFYLFHFIRETQIPVSSFRIICKAGTEFLIETEILRLRRSINRSNWNCVLPFTRVRGTRNQ